jgi:hypothetical protein
MISSSPAYLKKYKNIQPSIEMQPAAIRNHERYTGSGYLIGYVEQQDGKNVAT